MEHQHAMNIISGRQRSVAASAVRSALLAASLPYSVGMRIRRWAYRRGILPSHSAGVAVVCVGNITTGGTGKTPMVAWLVDRLVQAGCSPAVLTRGYRSVGGVSDEAALLARLCGVPVIVDGDRVAGAAKALSSGADVLVMDDGFQHMRLRRDMNIVLIDAANPFGFGHVLPRGLLREPVSALSDADVIVITHSDAVPPGDLDELKRRIVELAGQVDMVEAVHKAEAIVDDSGRRQGVESLAGKRVFAFCGLGRPEQFFEMLSGLGAVLVGRRALDDHAAYTPDVIESIAEASQDNSAEMLVTTAKDCVKCPQGAFRAPLWTLEMRIEFPDGDGGLADRVISLVR